MSLYKQKKAVVSGFSCLVPLHEALYLSTPITNGPIVVSEIKKRPELKKISTGDFEQFIKNEIIPKNSIKAHNSAAELRKSQCRVVIDPSCFFIEEWSQVDYLDLWEEVITLYAAEIWFNDGWFFSKGCVYEYSIGLKKQIPCFELTGEALAFDRSVELVSYGIAESQKVDIDTSGLEKSLETILSYERLK